MMMKFEIHELHFDSQPIDIGFANHSDAPSNEARKFKMLGIWLLLLSIFIIQLLAYTWCRVQCVRLGYEITREMHNYRQLIVLQDNLKIELARLKSPDRIGKIAGRELKLIPPSPDQLKVIP